MQRLALIMTIVATAAVASMLTMVFLPSTNLNAQGIVTTRTPDKAAATAAAAVATSPNYAISSYGFIEPKESRKDDTRWTLGFFVLNPDNGKVKNCIYMWSGSPMNKCMEYSWVDLP